MSQSFFLAGMVSLQISLFKHIPSAKKNLLSFLEVLFEDHLLNKNSMQIGKNREAGRSAMSSSSITLCGLARDCAENFKAIIPQLERLGDAFAHYKVIVVENDSQDQTASVLSDWCARNARVRPIQFCYRNTCESEAKKAGPSRVAWFGQNRMERMTFARNQYLAALSEEPLPNFVAVIDLDIRAFSMPGVEQSFGMLDDWDVITANGQRYSVWNPLRLSVYWDTYAFEPYGGFPDGIQTSEQIRQNQVLLADQLKRGELFPASSAFGGLTIYRAELLRHHWYSVIENDCEDVPVLCDHPTLHRSMRQQHKGLRLVINPHMTVNYGTPMQLAAQAWRTFTI